MIGTVLDVLSWTALLAGGSFYVIGAIGLNRMPDVFTRMHAVSVGDTLGAGLLVAGMLIQTSDPLVAAKLIIIILVLAFTGSVATHALARAALHDGVKPLLASREGAIAPADPEKAVLSLEDLAAPGEAGEARPSKL